jgi:3-deoxy-D-manno-octulosonic-acid transferase
MLFGFWVITANPRFVSCYGHQEEVLVISDFIQQLLADKQTLLLMLVSEQPRHKLRGDTMHVQVLC